MGYFGEGIHTLEDILNYKVFCLPQNGGAIASVSPSFILLLTQEKQIYCCGSRQLIIDPRQTYELICYHKRFQ